MVELLTDPARCQVMLVTLPEETPVNELVDTAFAIEDRAGVALGPIVVNGCVSEVDDLLASDERDRDRRRAQRRCARRYRAGRRRRGRARRGGRVPDRASATRQQEQRERLAGAAAAPADRAAVPLHGRHRPVRDRRCSPTRSRRASPRMDARTVDDARRTRRARVTSWSAAVPAVSARRRPPPRSRSKARGEDATRSSSRSIPRSGSRTRSGSSTCRTRRTRSRGRCGVGDGDAAVHGRLHALMLDTEVDVRPARRAVRGERGTGATHPREPLLPQRRRRALRHAGVHGDGEALRAARRRRAST